MTNEPPPEAARSTRLSWLNVITAGLVAILFVMFVVQNSEPVVLKFLSWTFETSRVVLMGLSAVAGVVIWELLTSARRRAKTKRKG